EKPYDAIQTAVERIAKSNPRPTAVLAYDTNVARTLIDRFGALGLSVPRDISVAAVAGAGDPLAGSMTLTYNRIHFVEMGAQAVRILEKRLKDTPGKRAITEIGSDLVVGNTAIAVP